MLVFIWFVFLYLNDAGIYFFCVSQTGKSKLNFIKLKLIWNPDSVKENTQYRKRLHARFTCFVFFLFLCWTRGPHGVGSISLICHWLWEIIGSSWLTHHTFLCIQPIFQLCEKFVVCFKAENSSCVHSGFWCWGKKWMAAEESDVWRTLCCLQVYTIISLWGSGT